MKKTYIAPKAMVQTVELQALLSASDPINNNGNGPAGYGGVDTEGTKEPSARRYSVWDEEEEEEF